MVRRPEVTVQFVEAGTDREQAITRSLNLGPDVGAGVSLSPVPAVLPLIGSGALREGPGLGDDETPPRSSQGPMGAGYPYSRTSAACLVPAVRRNVRAGGGAWHLTDGGAN